MGGPPHEGVAALLNQPQGSGRRIMIRYPQFMKSSAALRKSDYNPKYWGIVSRAWPGVC